MTCCKSEKKISENKKKINFFSFFFYNEKKKQKFCLFLKTGFDFEYLQHTFCYHMIWLCHEAKKMKIGHKL